MISVKFLVLQLVTTLVFNGNLAKGVTLYHGEEYPDVRVDLTSPNRASDTGNFCYRDVPAILFQTRQNEPVQENGTLPGFMLQKVCCEGYRLTLDQGGQCIADCSEVSTTKCRNGYCREPTDCECFEGFVQNDEGNCLPTCPQSCENGNCNLDGSCICKPGYYLEPGTKKYCLADCSSVPCGLNQICVAPGKCECEKGYKWMKGLGCQPICEPYCGYGQCVAPGVCECFGSFQKRLSRRICEAECDIKCENGFCESRNKCLCHVGFYYDDRLKTCLPSCPQGCTHGTCITPGVCRCFEGYSLINNICQPICRSDCGIGHCVAPNVCACHVGGQKCLNGGKCSALGNCNCPPGKTYIDDRCSEVPVATNVLHNDDEGE